MICISVQSCNGPYRSFHCLHCIMVHLPKVVFHLYFSYLMPITSGKKILHHSPSLISPKPFLSIYEFFYNSCVVVGVTKHKGSDTGLGTCSQTGCRQVLKTLLAWLPSNQGCTAVCLVSCFITENL